MKITKKLLIALIAAGLIAGIISCKDPSAPAGPSYIGTKAPSRAKDVGDIVFNDGSAMPYTAFNALSDAQKEAKKANAIAIIFYKGTEVSDNGRSRTLGVGLKHKKGDRVSWCLETANGYNIYIESIKTEPSMWDGKYVFDYDKDGSDNLEQIAQTLGKNDDTNIADNYPAFYYAKNYASVEGSNIIADTEFEGGWYLPCCAEFNELFYFGQVKLDSISKSLGGDEFDEDDYVVSSSVVSSDMENAEESKKIEIFVCCLKTSNPIMPAKKSFKNDEYYACAIREFN